MELNQPISERAILIGVHRGNRDELKDSTPESMEELRLLAETAGAEVCLSAVQNKAEPSTATYVGEGKLEEIKQAAKTLDANLLIVDDELSGSQLRNIEQETGVRVIDRSMLILDIFAGRAKTAEGKIQVELAQLKYTLPRLTGMGIALSRQGAGIATRGPGETKLETDRRHIHRRIASLRRELHEIETHRELLRSRRKKEETAVAALVGYTNAGKSTLMNRLTDADIFAENMLFATLDPTIRALPMPDGRDAVLVDTVGFIRKLPHHLIEAFRSTLEEAVLADVLIHVIDSSNPDMERQMEVVEQLLIELGCGEKPTIAVFNKCDAGNMPMPRPAGLYTDYVELSAKTGQGIPLLMEKLDALLPGKKIKLTLKIPFSRGDLVGSLHRTEQVLSETYDQEGTIMEVLLEPYKRAELAEFIKE